MAGLAVVSLAVGIVAAGRLEVGFTVPAPKPADPPADGAYAGVDRVDPADQDQHVSTRVVAGRRVLDSSLIGRHTDGFED